MPGKKRRNLGLPGQKRQPIPPELEKRINERLEREGINIESDLLAVHFDLKGKRAEEFAKLHAEMKKRAARMRGAYEFFFQWGIVAPIKAKEGLSEKNFIEGSQAYVKKLRTIKKQTGLNARLASHIKGMLDGVGRIHLYWNAQRKMKEFVLEALGKRAESWRDSLVQDVERIHDSLAKWGQIEEELLELLETRP